MIARIGVWCIEKYQYYFSPDTGLFPKLGFKARPTCVFYPTCSEYTKQALLKYGFLRGMFLGIKRIFRCIPWQKNHIDPLV